MSYTKEVTKTEDNFSSVNIDFRRNNNKYQTVNFDCRVSYVDRSENSDNNVTRKPTKMRFVVCTLGIFALTLSQMSRGVINYCITSMVDPRMIQDHNKNNSSSGSCLMPPEWHDNTEISTRFSNQSKAPRESEQFIADIKYDGPSKTSDNLYTDKFMWTIKQQSYVLGGFYYSYFLFMVLGGRLAEIYGAKYVLLLSVAGPSIINLATPWMARNSFGLLVASRIFMGALQSSVYPAIYALINRWLTMDEMSIYTSLVRMGLRLGQCSGGLIAGLITDWPNVFFVIGAPGVVWSILWLIISTSDPSTNRWVSKVELAHIEKKKKRKSNSNSNTSNQLSVPGNAQNDPMKNSNKTPWLKIISSPSVIGLMIVKLGWNLCNDFISVELPSYLKYVHHASIQRISAIVTAMFTVQILLLPFAGWSARVIVKKPPFGLSKTSIRKIYQSIVTLGSGSMLILLIFNGCNMAFVTIVVLSISFFLIFVVGGDMMLPYDLSEEYPATIMAVANSVANTSGAILTYFTGVILGDEGGSQVRWSIVMASIAGADILGGLLFCLLVKAKPINFNPKEENDLGKKIEKSTSHKPLQIIHSAPQIGKHPN